MRKNPILTILVIVIFIALLVEVAINWDSNDYNSLSRAEYRELLQEGKERK